MALDLDTYTNLLASIATTAHRSDLTAEIPGFIKLAESRFNNVLRVRQMEATATITLTTGAGTIPTDFLEAIRVTATSDPRRVLAYAPADWLDEAYPDRDTSDSSFYYINGSTIQTHPLSSSDLEMLYYQIIPDLQTNSTNWLLTRAPDIYLYGAMVELDRHTQADPMVNATLLAQGIKQLEDSENFNRAGVFQRRASTISP